MEVKAQLNNYRRSPRKVRLVAKMIAGLDAAAAENQLRFAIKGSAVDILKLLQSAVANAENNFGLDKANLYIKSARVDEGANLKRWLPRAHGRASLILKRTSYIEIVLKEKVEGQGRKKVKKQEIKEVSLKEMKKPLAEKAEKPEEEKKIQRPGARTIKSDEDVKEREEKEFLDEKKKSESSKGFLKRVFRRKSM